MPTRNLYWRLGKYCVLKPLMNSCRECSPLRSVAVCSCRTFEWMFIMRSVIYSSNCFLFKVYNLFPCKIKNSFNDCCDFFLILLLLSRLMIFHDASHKGAVFVLLAALVNFVLDSTCQVSARLDLRVRTNLL